VGTSDFSVAGNGAVILTVPTAPQTLLNNVAETNKDQIGITWYEGAQLSGTPVIDYRVWYTTVTADNYEILASNVVDTSYVALYLVPGTEYRFKV